MTLATWNLERLKHIKNLPFIIDAIKKVDADIFVLIEYDERVVLDYPYQISTAFIQEEFGVLYQATERRVKLFSSYEIIHEYETFNKHTSLCVELKTPNSNLIIYATIIGVLGNRHYSFLNDLKLQIEDFRRLGSNKHFCVMGDFNMSFADNYYFTKDGRNILNTAFEELDMYIPTASIKNNIDHIAISKDFTTNAIPNFWNEDTNHSKLKLSDHMGISVSIKRN
jgi:endonuclease/exonuclease/phosphatase family metal-dependent hydrolase